MSDFRTPVPGLFARFLEFSINQVLALDPDAGKRLERLDGRSLLLDLTGLNLSLAFGVEDDRFRVRATTPEQEADTIIRGTPAALFSLGMPEWSSNRSEVEIKGNATLARDMEQLFRKLDPDWEEPLTRLFGDVIGHQVAVLLRQSGLWAGKAARSTGAMLKDYLTEETRLSILPAELEAFVSGVDDLRDATDRLEANIQELEEAFE